MIRAIINIVNYDNDNDNNYHYLVFLRLSLNTDNYAIDTLLLDLNII